MMSFKLIVHLFLIILFVSACNLGPGEEKRSDEKVYPGSFEDIQQERDYQFMIMAYAMVYQDWQEDNDRETARGYNIGAILVNWEGEMVHRALNAVAQAGDITRHAEVRVIQEFLADHPDFSLEGYTLYTTLEPCVMCAGMMSFSKLDRVVYGQSDPVFGKAMERIHLDSRSNCDSGGYPPYPRKVLIEKSNDPVTLELDSLYKGFSGGMVEFLCSEEAKVVFGKAEKLLNVKI